MISFTAKINIEKENKMIFTFDSEKVLNLIVKSQDIINGHDKIDKRKDKYIYEETASEKLAKEKLHANNSDINVNNIEIDDIEEEEVVRLNLICKDEKIWITSNILYEKIKANEKAMDVINFDTWFNPDLINSCLEYDISADIKIEIADDEIKIISKIDNLFDCKT